MKKISWESSPVNKKYFYTYPFEISLFTREIIVTSTGLQSINPQRTIGNINHILIIKQIIKVDETVYCGGIEAALNQNLLCRLNIEYIVDLSGHEDDPALVNTRL